MSMHFNLADLFEAVADKVPSREALICGDSRSTYADLEKGMTSVHDIVILLRRSLK